VSYIERFPSQNRRWEAVRYDYSCGATTPYWAQVSLVRPGAKVSGGGNIFSSGDAQPPDIHWGGSEHLILSGQATDRYGDPPSVKARKRGVKIDFVAVSENARHDS
jgi:hypothetical protein